MFENLIKQVSGFKAFNLAVGEMLLLTVNNALADVSLATLKRFGLPTWAAGTVATFGLPQLLQILKVVESEGSSRLTVAIGAKSLDSIFKIEDNIESTINKLIGTLLPARISGAEDYGDSIEIPDEGYEEISGAIAPDAETVIESVLLAQQ